MLTLLGNAPSSGSTFLADLLDATPFTAAGPELGLFATTDAYRFDGREAPIRHASPATLYTTGVGVYRRGLPGYGLDAATVNRMRSDAKDFNGFANTFVDRYLALRGKDVDGVVFEKTPQNINRLNDFLAASTEGRFVFLVRDPCFVHRSVVRRGYSTWQAIGTWLIAAAIYLRHEDNPRVKSLRYEDLLSAPYERAARLIGELAGRPVTAEHLRENHENDRYRRIFETRVATWGQTDAGRVGDANGGLTIADQQPVAAALSWRVSRSYADLFGLEPLSLEEAMIALGYAETVRRLRQLNAPPARVGRGDQAFCLRRWGAAASRGEAGLAELRGYLQPITTDSRAAA